jgi:hypothetical protein
MIDTSLYCPSVSLDEGEDKSHTKILKIKKRQSKQRTVQSGERRGGRRSNYG